MNPLSYSASLLRLLEVTSSPRLGLGRMERLLAGLGDPQRGQIFVHVAGTNGKGSTVAFVDAILRAHKIKTGRTTSPHLTCARERICIEARPVSESAFVRLEGQVAAVAQTMRNDPPTFFERMTAMAFLAFKEANVDVGVVEVGLGGRLDATHVIDSEVVGITQIAKDHEMWLGADLQGIAREKIDIVSRSKSGAFTLPGNRAVMTTLRTFCDEHQKRLEVAAPTRWKTSLLGEHQRENAGLAVALCKEVLRSKGRTLDEECAKRALANTEWPGRSERVFLGQQAFFLDGAHNVNGARALAKVVEAEEIACVIVGLTSGHKEREMAEAISRLKPARIIVTQAKAPRSLSAEVVGKAFRRAVVMSENVKQAMEMALGEASHLGGTILVTGSLYLVGEARAFLLQMPSDPQLPLF